MKLQEILKKIPNKPGVYFFKNGKGEILYVGKARNLKQRVGSYFLPQLLLGPKTQNLVSQIEKIDCQIGESEFDALLLEAALIKKYQPKYNSRLKDDKSFLYIKISNEPFPRIYPARKVNGGYGPFPKAQTVRQILRFLRPIFPYRSCRRLPQKPCLYFDLKLCLAPCLGQVEKTAYRRLISSIKNLLEGKSEKVIRKLTRQMQESAKKNEFEKAAQVRDQIAKINWLREFHQPVSDYLENPNLIEDLRAGEIEDLKRQLKPYFKNLQTPLGRIEAYDISNIFGKKATGSMVVFIRGEADKSLYRKFKIKLSGKPDDVAMMKEVVRRRLTHSEWENPELILVDGGKGQVSGVMKVLQETNLKIPVIGLAKKEEVLVIPKQKRKFVLLRLPANSPALNLVLRLRDEAHRFALAYHQRLRTNF